MVRCKNASGAPSDGDDSPPRRTEVACGKRVKIAAKKRKRTLTEAEVAQAVADAAEAAERGGRSSGIRIGESRFHLEGRQLGTEATEETVDALQSSLQRIQRRLRSRLFRLHSIVAQDVRELR
jgi:hypothetical protein